jgi:adenylate kinase
MEALSKMVFSKRGVMAMWFALTGTPGTGKTSVAETLRERGWIVLDLNKIARDHGYIIGRDPERDTDLVDLDKVSRFLEKEFGDDKDIILEGHWAHKLQVQRAIVLRCNPKSLARRLRERDYKKSKIDENVEAELIDVILVEAVMGLGERCVSEIDTTRKGIRSTADAVERVLNGDFNNYKVGSVDWSGQLLKGRRPLK